MNRPSRDSGPTLTAWLHGFAGACTHRVVGRDEPWEQSTVRRLLTRVGTRCQHSVQVATRATQAARYLLPPDEAESVICAAWLHDIGYSPDLVQTGFHPLDGARWLRANGVGEPVCRLVAWHTSAFAEATERGMADVLMDEFPRPDKASLRVLTWSDLTSSVTGHPCTVDERIADILSRYPPGSPVRRAISAARAELTTIGAEVAEAIRSAG